MNPVVTRAMQASVIKPVFACMLHVHFPCIKGVYMTGFQ